MMKNRNYLSKLSNMNRKTLYFIFCIVILSIFLLTIAYASLSTTLNISGTTEVIGANWDVYFDNIQVNSASVSTATTPSKIDNRTINFAVELEKPGDFYKFTVDIVNGGSIDAMIDNIVKTPELTTDQAKYIKYEIEYIDGNSINSKQLLSKNTSKTISILIAYRLDVASSDIPTTGESLNLSFTLIYTQADETGTQIPDSTPVVRVVSGDIETVGSEICIGNECFYIISSDESSVTMLAKYNLYVGGKYDGNSWIAYEDKATGIQSADMLGYISGKSDRNGTIAFSDIGYWSNTVSSYPVYVYNQNSNLYTYVENYKNILENIGVTVVEARLINKNEIESLGCSMEKWDCTESSYSWIYSTSYWTGVAYVSTHVRRVRSDGVLDNTSFSSKNGYGVRPVIKILKYEFN